MSKKSKRSKKQSKMPVFKLVLAAAFIGLGAWVYFTYFAIPTSGRQAFSFTQHVGDVNTSGCVQLTYRDKDFCIDEWSKVYNVMDKQNQETSRTIGTTVKVDFDADFHTGSKMFVDDKESPTIFLDKVYSASATKQ